MFKYYQNARLRTAYRKNMGIPLEHNGANGACKNTTRILPNRIPSECLNTTEIYEIIIEYNQDAGIPPE